MFQSPFVYSYRSLHNFSRDVVSPIKTLILNYEMLLSRVVVDNTRFISFNLLLQLVILQDRFLCVLGHFLYLIILAKFPAL